MLTAEKHGLFGVVITSKVYAETNNEENKTQEKRGRSPPLGEALTRASLIVTYVVIHAVFVQIFSKVNSVIWTNLGNFLFPSGDDNPLNAAQYLSFSTFLNNYFIFWPKKLVHILGGAFLTGY